MTKHPPSCFIFAGEQSGDLLGSHLIKALKQRNRQIHFEGVAGPKMRQEEISCLLPMEEFQVMGFTDVIRSLPKLRKQFHLVLNHILKTNPDLCILIDYPGFNLRLAKALRKRGYKNRIVQYVCPTVWAHGKKRIDSMVSTLDLLLVILPFEPECFAGKTLNVEYVGHPLVNIISNHFYNEAWHKEIGLQSKENLIAIFPGSRQQEIARNFPKQLRAAELLHQSNPSIRFAISVARPELKEALDSLLKGSSLNITFVPARYSYELMRDCHSAIAKAGTVTLELALHHKPTVVVYEVSTLNRLYAKYLLKLQLRHFSLVNILGNKRIFPELIETGFTAENLCRLMQELHAGEKRQQCIDDCIAIEKLLKNDNRHSASENAAQAIEELLSI
jgi:lipid-A-disaccharide synthase